MRRITLELFRGAVLAVTLFSAVSALGAGFKWGGHVV